MGALSFLQDGSWWLNTNECTVQSFQLPCHKKINIGLGFCWFLVFFFFFLVSLSKVSHPNKQEIAEQPLLVTKDLHVALPKTPSGESVSFVINGCKEEGWMKTLTFDPKPTPEASGSNEILQIELDNPSSCVNLSLNWR